MSRTLRTLAVASALAAAGTTAIAAPAALAQPVFTGSFDFSDSWVETDCGFPLQIDAHWTGSQMTKDTTPASGGQFFRYSSRYRNTYVLTNLDTNVAVTEVDSGNFREMPGTPISDDGRYVTYETKDSGAFATYSAADGTVLLRDRGTVTFRYTFDTLGDGQPGGEFLSEDLVRVSGPHPSWDADFCQLMTDWTS